MLYDNLGFTRIYYFYNVDARVQNKMARGPTRFASSVECDKKGKKIFLTDFFAFLVFDHLSSGGPQYLYHFCFSVLRWN